MGKASAAFNIIFGAKTGKLSKDLKGVQRQMTILQRNLSNTGRKLTVGLTAPLAAIGASAFKVAADFEQSMARVRAVSGAAGKDFDNLRQLAEDLGKSTVFTASDVAGLEEAFARLGFSTDEILNATEATLNLAQASGTDLASAADVAGSTLRSFGLNATETGRVTDVMAASFSSTALDMDSFREAMKLVAPVAKSAGLSVEDTTALLGTLSNAGLRGSQAGTALRRIISELGATSGDVSGEIKKLAAEGLNLADAKDEVGRNAQSALLILAEGTDTTDKLSVSLRAAEGAAKGMADVMNDTAEGAMKRMQSAVQGAQIALGTALAPSVEAAAKQVGKLADSFSSLSVGAQKTIAGLGIFAAGIGPVTSGLAGMVGGVKNVVKGLKALRLAILANPVGALATALLAVGTAAITFISMTDRMTEEQRENLRITREQNLELARQAGLLKQALNLDIDLASVKELNTALSTVSAELDAFSSEKLAKDIVVDLNAKPFQQIQLGDAFADINPESARQIRENLQTRFAVLQSEAISQGLFGDDAAAFIQERLAAQLGQVTRNFRRDLEERQKEISAKLKEISERNQPPIELPEVSGKAATFDSDSEIGKVFDTLAEAENAALAVEELTGETAKALDDLSAAYFQAAQGAQELGFLDIAAQLKEQSDSFAAQAQEVRTSAEAVRKDIEENLQDLNAEVNVKLDLDGDQIGALQTLAQGYTEAAISAAQLGQVDLAEQLYTQAQAFEAQANAAKKSAEQTKLAAQIQQETLNTLAQSAQQAIVGIGQAFVQSNENYRRGLQELNAAFNEQQLSSEEYAEREKQLEKQRQIERAQAAANAIDTFLAEAIAALVSSAIKSAAAAGPGALALAPVLGSAASALVKGLFASQVPAFAEGGAVIGGPTLALLGDNPSGKEMVVPFEKLPQFLNMFDQKNATDVHVTGVLQGKDIYLSATKSQRTAQRSVAALAF